MKDPAFPFYAQDFLVGTMHMTFEEIGAYIKLLAYQWVNLGIPKNRIGSVLGSGWESIWQSISDKFIEKENVFYNERLEIEREKRAQFKQKQTENGKKGGRPKANTTNDQSFNSELESLNINKNQNPIINPKQNQKKPLEYENESEYENVNAVEKGKEGTGEKPIAVYPFESEAFSGQWSIWKQYRAKEHKFRFRSVMSEQAALAELGTLANGSETNAIAIMHQSIAKGWKGFFELKNDHGTTKPPAGKGKVQYSDDFKRKIAERLRSG
ncbi:DUF1376 domain-containing protein [Flavobacterium cerinum]|uniref:DUF1376 domain-containing protein n=1 Tax=Flavobacterium cerinum TaxID=2502784 RepID=A0A3S4T0P7_9FLAO|nr:DUF1376 domain-containing protein [Flavobacterium cerinum]RWW99691.1 DUF1376 domain-containing protein [Flavobacterium cerinum]